MIVRILAVVKGMPHLRDIVGRLPGEPSIIDMPFLRHVVGKTFLEPCRDGALVFLKEDDVRQLVRENLIEVSLRDLRSEM